MISFKLNDENIIQARIKDISKSKADEILKQRNEEQLQKILGNIPTGVMSRILLNLLILIQLLLLQKS